MGDQKTEMLAKIIFEAMRFDRWEDVPNWVEGGNSLAQDEARSKAKVVMELCGSEPLVWGEISENDLYARNADYRVVTDGKSWAVCPIDWPPFGGYPYKTKEEALSAAQESATAAHWAKTPIGKMVQP